jgi:hypothetical protein
MQDRRSLVRISLLLVLALVTAGAFGAPSSPAYRIVVHPENGVEVVTREFVRDAFLKKAKRWPGNTVLRPVDLAPRSLARKPFSEQELGRSVQAVRAYWQQRIFSGRDVPPPEFEHDAQVIDYVLKHPGAVGYVSGGADLRGAKPVSVRP